MTQEEWKQIDELLQAALNEAPGDRAAFLDRVCAGNEVMRREVESLLGHDDQAKSFLEQPPGEVAAELLTSGTSRFLSGQLLNHYRIVEFLGAGGMGEVYLARDTKLDRPVAIKVLAGPFTSDSDKVRRFEQEARAASALNHPNIVTIHEVGRADGVHYIVAEYIEGQTLRQRLAQSGPMKAGEALDVALQVASALDAAHAAGIVHRDIKPDNVMLRPDRLVKVLDFGLAKLSEPKTFVSDRRLSDSAASHTNPGVVMGTARYMSPEQARGLKVDARTDIWSLGVVLFEMLAGAPPFDGETPSHVIVDILDEPAPRVAARVNGISPELERIVDKSLCKNVGERYRTAKEFADNLRNVRLQLDGRGGLDQSITSGENRPRFRPVHWRRRGAIAVLATLVLTAGGFRVFTKPDQRIQSLAVLAFVNGGDAATEYLSDGVSEGLVNSLSQIHDLQISPRSVVSQYKDASVDPSAIGRELGVRAILIGRVASHGEDVDMRVDLLDAEKGSHLWGKTFRRPLMDLLGVQKEIVAAVASTLGVQRGAAKSDTKSNEAYQLYLQGRYYWQKSGAGEANLKMGDYFQKAIAIDPNYALAYAGLADYYATMGLSGRMPGAQAWPKSEEAAFKALALDESTGEAHQSLAAVRIWYDRNWREAEKELKRAIELKPDFAEGHALYSKLLDATGRVDEAIVEQKRASEVAPHTPHRGGRSFFGEKHFHARRYDLAAEEFRKSVENDPGNPNEHIGLGEVYVQQKKLAEAVAEARKAKALIQNNFKQLTRVGAILAAAGDTEEATKILVEAKKRQSKVPILAHNIALIYAALGNNTEAIAWLTKSIDEFDSTVVDLKVDPRFDTLRQDPRFPAVLGRMKLLP
jgi:eukaryotic-like serine/threonine-protein kinase